MHAGILTDHSTGSMVSIVNDKSITVWITGSSTPCLSIFKPLYFNPTGDFVVPPCFTNEQESLQYWLKREKLNRLIYTNNIDIGEWMQKARTLEKEFIEEDRKLASQNATYTELVEFSKRCSQKEEDLVNEYIDKINAFDYKKLPRYWSKKSKNLGKNVFERELWKRKA